MKALFLSIDYDSASGAYEFILMEDAERKQRSSLESSDLLHGS